MNQENNNQSKNNLTAIVIGFAVMILVTGAILSKNYFFREKKEIATEKTEDVQEENQLSKNYNSVSSDALLKKINGREDFEILDVREYDEFEIKHIKDSKNVPPADFDEAILFFDKKKEIIFVADFGLTPIEIEAMDLFLANGFENISYLEGGISAWENDFNPLINIGDPYSFTDQSKVTYIKSDELKKIVDSEFNYLYILDLREENDFLIGHLKNAVNIPLSEIEDNYRQIPSGKKIILYSEDNLAAFQGAVRLFDLGIFNVFTLSDGLIGWKEKGFEIVK